MPHSRRIPRSARPQVEVLEARDQPSILPFTPLDAAPWLDLDFGLGERPQPPETLARLRTLLTPAQETAAATGASAVPHANSVTTSAAPVAPTAATAAADRALLLA